MGAEEQHLKTVGAGLEGSRDARADPYRVERRQLHQLLIELYAP
jgi:hypothetical protein